MQDEYFIYAQTFAAPFVSETVERYITADSPEDAITALVDRYRDRIGIYSAAAYASADDFHKDHAALATWICNKQTAIDKATAGKRSYSLYSDGPTSVEINDKSVAVDDPYGGGFV